jgi:hypothetical protein
MGALEIRFKKKRDGTNTLTCVRPDGTVTGQRQSQDGFFVMHDLSHYAVESTLGLCGAFFGLLARGWDIEDFGTPWPRGPIPPDAIDDASLAEHFAGSMDAERHGGIALEVEAFNKQYTEACAEYGMTPKRLLTEADLTRVRARLDALTTQWKELPPGETLVLSFGEE